MFGYALTNMVHDHMLGKFKEYGKKWHGYTVLAGFFNLSQDFQQLWALYGILAAFM